MPDTPFMLRGEYYNTTQYYKCAAFNKCVACSLCTNYNPSSLVCNKCENRKSPKTVCECTNKTKESFIAVTNKLRRPFFDPDMKPGNVELADVSFDKDWNSIMGGLQGTYGRLSQIEETRD